jgi:hypothetical protein
MEFKQGQLVDVVMRGTMRLGNTTFTDCTFAGVTIARNNADGTYQVRGMIKTLTSDEVTVPSDWIRPV